jgi:hypothetical protein
MKRLPIVLMAILLFLGFLKMNIGCKNIINVIASATFGVYLIHDNYYVRPFLWENVFSNASFSENRLLIPYSVMEICVVFIVCTVIELIRIYLFEKRYIGLLNSISNKISLYIERLFSKIN